MSNKRRHLYSNFRHPKSIYYHQINSVYQSNVKIREKSNNKRNISSKSGEINFSVNLSDDFSIEPACLDATTFSLCK